jgi:hypothetical protein
LRTAFRKVFPLGQRIEPALTFSFTSARTGSSNNTSQAASSIDFMSAPGLICRQSSIHLKISKKL